MPGDRFGSRSCASARVASGDAGSPLPAAGRVPPRTRSSALRLVDESFGDCCGRFDCFATVALMCSPSTQALKCPGKRGRSSPQCGYSCTQWIRHCDVSHPLHHASRRKQLSRIRDNCLRRRVCLRASTLTETRRYGAGVSLYSDRLPPGGAPSAEFGSKQSSRASSRAQRER
jgi:hypothetical protein